MKKIRILKTVTILGLVLSGCASAPDQKPEKTPIKENAVISYLGPEGTYTEEAAKYFFSGEDTFQPKQTVDDAIKDVLDGNADYGVIPQENTIGGPVTNYVDALISQKDVYVVGEVVIPISQTLLGVPGAKLEDIQLVCSHVQGLTQSKKWREENLPNAKEQEMDSTAAAASYVAEMQDPAIAAVAAPGAADIYHLEVLAENVQITDTNKTRFYVLSKEPSARGAYSHAVFVATCNADQIDDIIVEIHQSGLELVALHDRPEGSELGKYYYVIEVVKEDGITAKQIEQIEKIDTVRFAGTFDVAVK